MRIFRANNTNANHFFISKLRRLWLRARAWIARLRRRRRQKSRSTGQTQSFVIERNIEPVMGFQRKPAIIAVVMQSGENFPHLAFAFTNANCVRAIALPHGIFGMYMSDFPA